MDLAVTIVGYVLAAAFILAGAAKLAQVKVMKDNFAKYGFPEWFPRVVGAGEVTGGVLLLIPGLAIFGATGLAIIMVGAVWTHVMSQEVPKAMPAFVLLVGSIFIVFGRTPDFVSFVA